MTVASSGQRVHITGKPSVGSLGLAEGSISESPTIRDLSRGGYRNAECGYFYGSPTSICGRASARFSGMKFRKRSPRTPGELRVISRGTIDSASCEPTSLLLFCSSFNVCEQLVERGAIQKPAIYDDRVDLLGIADILERVGGEQHQIGDVARFYCTCVFH